MPRAGLAGPRAMRSPSLESISTDGSDAPGPSLAPQGTGPLPGGVFVAGNRGPSHASRPQPPRTWQAATAEVYTEIEGDELTGSLSLGGHHPARTRAAFIGDRNDAARAPTPTLPHTATPTMHTEGGRWPGEGRPAYELAGRGTRETSPARLPTPTDAERRELFRHPASAYTRGSGDPVYDPAAWPRSPAVDLDDIRLALPPGTRHETSPTRGRESRKHRAHRSPKSRTPMDPRGDPAHVAAAAGPSRGIRAPSPALRLAGLVRIADPFAFTESVLLNEEEGVPLSHASACHAACADQPGVCCVASLCCLTAPCMVLQERRLLLFQTIRSRYLCCLGAVPCCWPPAMLRPELYLTYVAPSAQAEARRVRRLEEWQQGQQQERDHEGVDDVAVPLRYPPSRTGKYPPVGDAGEPVMPPVTSVEGVSAVGSVMSTANGLPQYGAYNSVRWASTGSRSRAPHTPGGPGAPSPSPGAPTGAGGCSCCCGCCFFSSDTNTCTLDYTQGCCLYTCHPTACCLLGGCPICCLVTEVCCCLPCAALGNRLLLRKHYGLPPDPLVDYPVACMYSCCLTCLTGRGRASDREAYASGAASDTPASCWRTFARSVASALAATCCLWPCLCCSLAQQRDVVERHGYPLLSSLRPSDITGMS